MRREFPLYGAGLPPLPPPWGIDEAAQEQERQRELERARESDLIARAHRKLSLEVERVGPSRPRSSRRPSEASVPPQPQRPPPLPPQPHGDYREFGYPSEAMRPRESETSTLPPPMSPGEALALPLPRDEWKPRVKRPPGFRV
jgi:hypothetical protein